MGLMLTLDDLKQIPAPIWIVAGVVGYFGYRVIANANKFSNAPQEANIAADDLANRLSIQRSDVYLQSWAPVTFTNICLGIGFQGKACPPQNIPGYIITLYTLNGSYRAYHEYRATQNEIVFYSGPVVNIAMPVPIGR